MVKMKVNVKSGIHEIMQPRAFSSKVFVASEVVTNL